MKKLLLTLPLFFSSALAYTTHPDEADSKEKASHGSRAPQSRLHLALRVRGGEPSGTTAEEQTDQGTSVVTSPVVEKDSALHEPSSAATSHKKEGENPLSGETSVSEDFQPSDVVLSVREGDLPPDHTSETGASLNTLNPTGTRALLSYVFQEDPEAVAMTEVQEEELAAMRLQLAQVDAANAELVREAELAAVKLQLAQANAEKAELRNQVKAARAPTTSDAPPVPDPRVKKKKRGKKYKKTFGGQLDRWVNNHLSKGELWG